MKKHTIPSISPLKLHHSMTNLTNPREVRAASRLARHAAKRDLREVTSGDRLVELNGEAKDGAGFVKGIEVAPASSWMELTVLKYTK